MLLLTRVVLCFPPSSQCVSSGLILLNLSGLGMVCSSIAAFITIHVRCCLITSDLLHLTLLIERRLNASPTPKSPS